MSNWLVLKDEVFTFCALLDLTCTVTYRHQHKTRSVSMQNAERSRPRCQEAGDPCMPCSPVRPPPPARPRTRESACSGEESGTCICHSLAYKVVRGIMGS